MNHRFYLKKVNSAITKFAKAFNPVIQRLNFETIKLRAHDAPGGVDAREGRTVPQKTVNHAGLRRPSELENYLIFVMLPFSS